MAQCQVGEEKWVFLIPLAGVVEMQRDERWVEMAATWMTSHSFGCSHVRMFFLTRCLRIVSEWVSRCSTMLDTLVLSGGAQYAAAFIGVFRYLEHTGLRPGIRRIIGSSAGAILGLLFVLGLTSDEMVSWISHLVEQERLNQISLDGALDFIETFGIDKGDNITAAITSTLQKYGPALQLTKQHITLHQLMQTTQVELIICTLNVSSKQFEYLSGPSAPNLALTTAIRMSTAIPLLYAPVLHAGSLYVDPLFGRNLPYDCPSIQALTSASLNRILGIQITGCNWSSQQQSPKGTEQTANNTGLLPFLSSLLNVVIEQANPCQAATFKTLDINVKDVPSWFSLESLSFQWTHAHIAALMHIGYCQAKKLLDSDLAEFLQNSHRILLHRTESASNANELLHHKDEQNP